MNEISNKAIVGSGLVDVVEGDGDGRQAIGDCLGVVCSKGAQSGVVGWARRSGPWALERGLTTMVPLRKPHISHIFYAYRYCFIN